MALSLERSYRAISSGFDFVFYLVRKKKTFFFLPFIGYCSEVPFDF